MKIYTVYAYHKPLHPYLETARYILYSFFYIRQDVKILSILEELKTQAEMYKDRVILDSGAFTFQQKARKSKILY